MEERHAGHWESQYLVKSHELLNGASALADARADVLAVICSVARPGRGL